MSVTIPDSVTSIGDSAFYYCTSLTSVTISDSVTSIGFCAFWGCTSLRSVTIPDSVTSIGDYTFYGCTNITDVYYSGTEEDWNKITIGSNNDPLTSATIHFTEPEPTVASGECGENLTWTLYESGLLEITGTGAMTDCSASSTAPWYAYRDEIQSVNIGNGVTNIGEYAFFACYVLTGVIIPDSITIIGEYAFCYCDSLSSVIIGNNVSIIGDYAFAQCDKLKTITIPDSVTSIGELAFLSCYSLTDITVSSNNKYYSNDSYGVLFDKNKTTLLHYPIGNERESYLIPNGVISIGPGAFYESYYLKNVTIPDGVINIDMCAFYNCIGLINITIPDGVTAIGGGSFAFCKSLTSVTIPDSVISIGVQAFFDCDYLESVTISNNATIIEYGAFGDCANLTSVTLPISVTTIDDLAFYECNSLTDVYYGGTEEDWNKITIGSNNDPLTSATIHFTEPEPTVASGECGENLTWTLYESGLLEITGTGAMYDWSYSSGAPWYNYRDKINAIKIDNEVTTIGNYAFYGGSNSYPSYCYDNLTSITIPDSVTSIGEYAFAYCKNLTSVTIGNSVTTIGFGVFAICESLTSVTIPDSVTSIGEMAFSCCTSLTDVYYGSTEDDWNKITIGSDNEPLTSANIHYSYVKPSVAPVNGAVVDNENGTIYGLVAGVDSLDSYIELADGYEWSYNEGQYGFGTGTVATLKNGDEIIEEYTIVIFGDIQGDGWYDANDAFLVNMMALGLLDESKLSDAEKAAADCNHDGVINELDFELLINASVLLEDVDQSATKEDLATNAMYISYCSLIDQTAGEETNLIPVPDNDEAPSDSTADAAPSEPAEANDFEAIFTMIIDFFKKIFTFVFSFVIK